jgi:predicted  nucleic acid-binding Zn-ribbon protein
MGVSAAPELQAQLLDLAEHDRALSRASQTLHKLPETLNLPDLEQKLDAAKTLVHDAMTEKETIEAELARAESDVELVEARIAKDTDRLVHTSSAKDAQGLEHELETLRKRRSDLEDIELAIMERMEQADDALAEAKAQLNAAEQGVAAATAELVSHSAALEADIAGESRAREVLVAGLPEDLYALYERQRERYGVGASHLRGSVSGASGVKLTEADLHTIRRAAPDEVMLCPDSNAILVRTAESGL